MKTDVQKSNDGGPAFPGPDIPLFDLLKRAQDGDQAVWQRLRALLQQDGDLLAEDEMGHLVDVKLSKMGAGDNMLLQEAQLR